MPTVARLAPDAAQIAQLAQRCGAEQLVLTHLRNQMDSERSHQAMCNAVRQNYTGNFSIAEDLMQFDI